MVHCGMFEALVERQCCAGFCGPGFRRQSQSLILSIAILTQQLRSLLQTVTAATLAPARPQTEATPNATEFTQQIVADEAK